MNLKLTLPLIAIALFVVANPAHSQNSNTQAANQPLLKLLMPVLRHSADKTETLHVGNLDRTFIVHLPPDYSAAKKYPVVLALHGGTGTAQGVPRLTGLNEVADKQQFIVVYPDGIDRHWNDGRDTIPNSTGPNAVDDVAFISALIDHLKSTLRVDPARIYATGISNGGFMSMRLACELSDKIAAVAAIAATMPANYAFHPPRPISVMIIHGTEDPLIPYTGGKIRGTGTSSGGYGGTAMSVDTTIKRWVEFDKCNATPKTETLPEKEPDDGTTTRRETYTGGAGGTEVVLYTVAGGGHTWPGGMQYAPAFLIGRTSRDFSASEAVSEFFSAQQLK